MSKYLSMASVRGSMKILCESEIKDIITALGCTEADWKLVRGPKPWLGKDRPRVMRVLEGCFYGLIDTLGVPRFQVPAELCAGAVTLMCHPTNYWTAAAWIGAQRSTEDIMTESVEGLEEVQPNKIFALITECVSDEICSTIMEEFNVKFTKKLNEQNLQMLQVKGK